MSFLLDAVGREKQAQGQFDVTSHAPLAPKRTIPWHYGWPLLSAVIAAGGAYLWQTRPLDPLPAPEPVVAEVALVGEVSMPLPIAFEPPKPEPVIEEQPMPEEYVYRPEPVVEAKPDNEADAAEVKAELNAKPLPDAKVASQMESQLNDNALLAAFKAAVADSDFEQVAQPQTQPQSEPRTQQSDAELQRALNLATQQVAQQPQQPRQQRRQRQPEPTQMSAEELLNLNVADYNQGNYQQPQAQSPAQQQPAQPDFSGIAPELNAMPLEFRKSMPDINITAHVYSSESDSRWLRANGREVQEGDLVAPGVKVKEIQPNAVVLEKEGQAFTVPALGRL